MADSYVAVFDAKYHYQFWRPTMAIRWADGNEKTTSGSWLPLLPTPPFPEYPSATPLPAGALKSCLRVHSAAARRLPRPAPPCYLLDTVAISAALMTHLGNALRVECFVGP